MGNLRLAKSVSCGVRRLIRRGIPGNTDLKNMHFRS